MEQAKNDGVRAQPWTEAQPTQPAAGPTGGYEMYWPMHHQLGRYWRGAS